MKKLTKLFAIFAMLMAGVACSEPEDYNPVIDTPTKGDSTDNNYNDKEKLSIVGTWRNVAPHPEDENYTITCTFIFNPNGSGSYSVIAPSWGDDVFLGYRTITYDFAYQYEYELGVLTLFGGQVIKEEQSAFIVSDGKATVLHLNNAVYRKVQ